MSVEALTADGYKLAKATATGPAASGGVTVNSAKAGSVPLVVAANPAKILEIEAVRTITGLPEGIALVGITYTGTSTITLTVYNATGSNITINQNAVTATVLCKAI